MALLKAKKNFDEQGWCDYVAANAGQYQAADPFPHIVIDDFLPSSVVGGIVSEFPSLTSMQIKSNKTTRNKGTSPSKSEWGQATRRAIEWLNSESFVRGLEILTGVQGLQSDNLFEGGGLHQIGDGGFLKIHADFNIHKTTGYERRVNLLFYLNDNWPESFGGHLELWNITMERCVRRIAPISNRCVIFSTSDSSYHGHPDPVNCGPKTTRKSIALYYYTSPTERKDFHSTLYRARPGESFKKKTRWGIFKS